MQGPSTSTPPHFESSCRYRGELSLPQSFICASCTRLAWMGFLWGLEWVSRTCLGFLWMDLWTKGLTIIPLRVDQDYKRLPSQATNIVWSFRRLPSIPRAASCKCKIWGTVQVLRILAIYVLSHVPVTRTTHASKKQVTEVLVILWRLKSPCQGIYPMNGVSLLFLLYISYIHGLR